jgi:deoxyadenosine/deoxycytidine kinase
MNSTSGIPYRYIVVEGNIGAGKTSLATILANVHNANLVLESFAENTFLPQFYAQPERFAFPLEMSFLAERYQQIHQAQQHMDLEGRKLVGDYIFEKSRLFADVNLKGAELDLFGRFFNMIEGGLRKPDLLIYLHKSTPTLLRNIARRGREYEQQIKAEYLDQLSQRYLDYLSTLGNQRILLIESDELDFVERPDHLRIVLDLVMRPFEPVLTRVNPL